MRFMITFALLCLSIKISAQIEKLKSITLQDAIVDVAVDRAGDIYLICSSGQMYNYNQDGVFKNNQKNSPTLFDPHDGARMFAYYRISNSYAYLTPSFTALKTFKIDTTFAIEPWLVCPSGDFNIWVIDAADKSLKKLNPDKSTIEAEVKLDTLNISEIDFVREYQGFLFMLYNHSDILIYNSIGKFLKNINGKHRDYFNFLGEELYYLEGNKLKFFDLFSAETREMKLSSVYKFALITDERLILIKDKTVDIMKLSE